MILLLALSLQILAITGTFAHPGPSIVVDKYGQIYFTGTGKGVWKIDTKGKLTYMDASEFHWMAITEILRNPSFHIFYPDRHRFVLWYTDTVQTFRDL